MSAERLPSSEQVKKILRGSQLAEFYAGWNAAIHTVHAVAEGQGWWLPESVLQLLVDEREP